MSLKAQVESGVSKAFDNAGDLVSLLNFKLPKDSNGPLPDSGPDHDLRSLRCISIDSSSSELAKLSTVSYSDIFIVEALGENLSPGDVVDVYGQDATLVAVSSTKVSGIPIAHEILVKR